GDERQISVRGGGGTQVGQQPLVVRDRGRDEDSSLGGRPEERTLVLRRPLLEDAPEIRRELVCPDGFEPPARGHEYRGGASAERLGRSLGDRLERGVPRQRLPENGREPVEAALDPRLACPLGEHLGVPQRK